MTAEMIPRKTLIDEIPIFDDKDVVLVSLLVAAGSLPMSFRHVSCACVSDTKLLSPA